MARKKQIMNKADQKSEQHRSESREDAEA